MVELRHSGALGAVSSWDETSTPTRVQRKDRRCSFRTCDTILSIYNPDPRCSVHAIKDTYLPPRNPTKRPIPERKDPEGEIEHGTLEGLYRHQRLKTKMCDPCRRAINAMDNNWGK